MNVNLDNIIEGLDSGPPSYPEILKNDVKLPEGIGK